MQVVQYWRQILGAKCVISTTADHNCVGHGQEPHLVAEPGARRVSRRSHVYEFASDDFAVDCGWFKIPQFSIVKLVALFEFTSEIVNTLLNLVTLADVVKVFGFFRNHCASGSLREEVYIVPCELHFYPLVVIKVVSKHVLNRHSVFRQPTKHDH